MKKEEALEIVRKNMPSDKSLPVYEALQTLIPELAESEDERIRKELLEEIESIIPHEDETDSEGLILPSYHTRIDRYKSYLEKQKDLDKMIVVSPEVWDTAIADAYENGKKDEEKQKEQKPAEKQDYSGLNDLERVIHRGFLCAGVENVPVTIIKETAKECLEQMKPAEWMAGQGVMDSIEGTVCGRVYDHINCGRVYDHINIRYNNDVGKTLEPRNISHIPVDVNKYKIGDKVIVQIRKKTEV